MIKLPRIETRSVADLRRAEYNPRKISEVAAAGLRRSLERWGLVEVPVWNERSGTLVGGHQRLDILESAGVEETPVVVVDLDDGDERALNVTLNNPAIQGAFTTGLAALEEPVLKAVGRDDFETLRLDRLFGSGVGVLGDDEAPAAGDAKTRLGDVILCGPHRLVCGDSTDPEVCRLATDGDLAVMVWTDPPYGVEYEGSPTKARAAIENDALGFDGTRDLVAAAAKAWPLAKGGVFYVCSPSGAMETAVRVGLLGSNLPVRQGLAWDKSRATFGRSDYHWRHETILYGWRPGARHRHHGEHARTSIWSAPKPQKSPDHPTMKPVELVMMGVADGSLRGELVFDGFSGSGSTMIACERSGRRFAGVELEPRYCDVIARRYMSETDIEPTVLRDGAEHKFSEL